jgi:hypothetical protein
MLVTRQIVISTVTMEDYTVVPEIGTQQINVLNLNSPRAFIHLISTDTHPNKSTKLALDTIRAIEIAIENPETGKVTAVVTMLKVFGDKINNSQKTLIQKVVK